METYKSISKAIIIIIALIIAFFVTYCVIIDTPNAVAAFTKDYPSEQEYEDLKEEAKIVVKTWDKEEIIDKVDNITLDDEFIKVTLDTERCGIKAKYPIEIDAKGNGMFNINILYEEGVYEEYMNIKGIWYYIFEILFLIAVTFGVIYYLSYFVTVLVPCDIWNIIKQKKEKNKES